LILWGEFIDKNQIMKWWIITGLTTAVIVFIDLLRVFSVFHRKTFFWVSLFVSINALLSVAMHCYLFDNASLANLPSFLKSIVLGIAYLVLVHTKIATIVINEQEIPVGLELAYENFKGVIYRQINRESLEVQYINVSRLAQASSLKDLVQKASYKIRASRITSEEEKENQKIWLLEVVTDPRSTEESQKIWIAHFLLYGERSSSSDLDAPW
jgi:hypothetical protein